VKHPFYIYITFSLNIKNSANTPNSMSNFLLLRVHCSSSTKLNTLNTNYDRAFLTLHYSKRQSTQYVQACCNFWNLKVTVGIFSFYTTQKTRTTRDRCTFWTRRFVLYTRRKHIMKHSFNYYNFPILSEKVRTERN